MKILLVHNNYGKYSGEEAVVDKMAAMFQSLGHKVTQYRMSTEGSRDSFTGQVKGFLCGIYYPAGIKRMRKVLHCEKPDVVNVHNLYPFISPAALRECKKVGIPVVMTIHNFRLMCPTGLFMRNDRPCELCLQQGNEWGCIRHNCEHSLLKSIGYAARNAVARLRRHYIDCIDRFACITDFQRNKLIEAGFPVEKIVVIPNSIDIQEKPTYLLGSYVAYCGRISREKGVDMIIEAARRHPEIPFHLAGAVRDKEIVENLPANVKLVGYLSGDALSEFYSAASFFVMASRCYEGFPMTILEASHFGKPTVSPNHGGFTEIIGTGSSAIGELFRPGDVDELEAKIVRLWDSPTLVRRLGIVAFDKLQREYSIEVVSRQWERLLYAIAKQP